MDVEERADALRGERQSAPRVDRSGAADDPRQQAILHETLIAEVEMPGAAEHSLGAGSLAAGPDRPDVGEDPAADLVRRPAYIMRCPPPT